jgi:hypothetical protein
MLRPDQIERLQALGENQFAIAQKWDKEREERGKIYDEIADLWGSKKPEDQVRFHELVEKMSDVPSRCEHDRSIWSPCCGCNEIEHALNPEFYDENGDRLDDDTIDALVEADPERYGIPKKG